MQTGSIKRVVVVGAGLMGHGIALEFAVSGYDVGLCDLNDQKLKEAVESIKGSLGLLADMGQLNEEEISPALERITTSPRLSELISDADLAVESVVEDMEVKGRVFQELDQLCPEKTILASNSSSFMPSRLARFTQRPTHVLVTHYFNPPYLLPVVEVVPSSSTDPKVVATMFESLRGIGKHPVLVRKEAPGFIGNRLQAALVREALALVHQGIASPKDIDLVIKSGFGRRYSAAGAFEIFDIAGWDLVHAVAAELMPVLESSPGIPPVLEEKVNKGELGLKTGQGFYEWTPESAAAVQRRMAGVLLSLRKVFGEKQKSRSQD